jgi:ABC-type sugar transport system ATPase subunit
MPEIARRPTSDNILVRATGISKRFKGTQALSDVNLALARGEIHALVGANGAGKSTFARILSGHIMHDAGRIEVDGVTVNFRNPREAMEGGISIVTQETSLAPDLSVLENMFLPEMGKRVLFSPGRLKKRAAEIIDTLSLDLNFTLDALVMDLPMAQRQLVEILKVLVLDSRTILLDEPTTSLSPYESEKLFDLMQSLAQRDRALVLVSHRMEEIFNVSDRVTVLREGRLVEGGLDTRGLQPSDLIRLMVGRSIKDVYGAPQSDQTENRVTLRVDHLRVDPVVRDVSFSIHEGEIFGLGGLVGSGRSEIAEALFGLRSITEGEVTLFDRKYRPRAPIDAIRAGVGLVGEDRRRQGLVPDLSVVENLLLVHLALHKGFRRDYGGAVRRGSKILTDLGIAAARIGDADILNFSGGMQQKVIFARWLLAEPRLLILDEPTRGVDIETRSSIYELLRSLAAAGISILVISSDFEELLGICSRIAVISDGADAATIPANLLDVEKLTMFAAPRTSANRVSTVLGALAETFKGNAFWVYVENARLFCFDSVVGPGQQPILRKGSFGTLTDSPLAVAADGTGAFAVDPVRHLAVFLTEVKSRRGHNLGAIGISLPESSPRPSADELQTFIDRSMTTSA